MTTEKPFEFKDKPYFVLDIAGYRVEVRKVNTWFCAYARLPDHEVLSDTYLGYPTFREGDWVGVDTNHSYHQGYTDLQKFESALEQIKGIIEQYRKATEESYYGNEDEDGDDQ